ncbi:hypothetical protein HZS_1662 [Henneguya salminicola]|nr:hypothetical protein HZS_1662 [Henneguya salminicola]
MKQECWEEWKDLMIVRFFINPSALQSVILIHIRSRSTIIPLCFKSPCILSNTYAHLRLILLLCNGYLHQYNRGRLECIKTRINPINRTSSSDKNGEQNQDGINDYLDEFQWKLKNSLDTRD